MAPRIILFIEGIHSEHQRLENPKIDVVWNSNVVRPYGTENGMLEGVKFANKVTSEIIDLKVSGVFFAIRHESTTKFLGGYLELDTDGYATTNPGSTLTTVQGVYDSDDVEDKTHRQAITAAGSGCMVVLDAEHYLYEIEAQEGKID